jgi:hypothetical protein
MKKFFTNIDVLSTTKGYDERLVGFLGELKEYIKTEYPFQYRNSFKYMPLWGKTDLEISNILGMSKNTVSSAKRLMSNELYESFGHDFFTVAVNNLKEAKMRLIVVKNYRNVDTVLVSGFVDFISKNKNLESLDIDIEDCNKEIEFLKKYSRTTIKRDLKELDRDKIEYLIGILENKVGSPKNRFDLISSVQKGLKNESNG